MILLVIYFNFCIILLDISHVESGNTDGFSFHLGWKGSVYLFVLDLCSFKCYYCARFSFWILWNSLTFPCLQPVVYS